MTARQAKIAVYGAGAMGTVLGALLSKAGLNVTLITRNQAHVLALQTNGAIVECQADGKTLQTPVCACLSTEMDKDYDVIFLMTKQRKNAETATFLADKLADGGVIVTTQNGLPEPLLAEILGSERVYGGVASFGANYLDEGRVALTSKLDGMRLQVGGYENSGKALPLLEEILTLVQKETNPKFLTVTENLIGARWSKLAINAAFSGLSVVTGLTFGEVAQKDKTRKLALGVLRECVAVATAAGVKMEKTHGFDMAKILGGNSPFMRLIAYLVLPFTIQKHKNLVSGMLLDIQNGKKCEIDFIDGVVVKEGARLGVEAPICSQIVEIAHGIENGLYEIDYSNVDFFAL